MSKPHERSKESKVCVRHAIAELKESKKPFIGHNTVRDNNMRERIDRAIGACKEILEFGEP